MQKDLDNISKSLNDFRKERAELNAKKSEVQTAKNPDLVNKVTAGLFSKCLEHDPTTYLASQDDIDAIITAVESGEDSDFEAIPLSSSATRKLEEPQAALAFTMSGADPESITLPAVFSLDSRKQAVEMLEVYERNILRDIPFNVISGDVTGTAQQETDLTRAIAMLNSFGDDYTGPKVGGVVTRKSLFRGIGKDELVGPYMSQFLLHDIPLGQHIIVQRSITETGEYGYNEANYLAIQNGAVPVAQTKGSAVYSFSPRVLGSFVHLDYVYQAFLYASALLLGRGAARNKAFPSSDKTTNFVTAGGPADIAAAIGEISSHALKATWVQKWRKNLKLRPEAMAGRVVKVEDGTLPASTIHPDLLTLGADTLAAVKAFNSDVARPNGAGDNASFLPLQFAEGSPTHPSSGAGHAGIAGACGTLLKMYFEDGPWSGLGLPNLHSIDGSMLDTYSEADASSMTIHGELNKLMSCMSYGRDFTGVHFRFDGEEGIKLGEKIAIDWFIDNAAQSNKNIGTIKFTGADGVTEKEVKTV